MTICRKQLMISAFALVVLGAVAMTPGLLGNRVASAMSALGGASHGWLLLAIIGFVGAFACTVGAWRAGFIAAGAKISPQRAASGLGIGQMVIRCGATVNTIANMSLNTPTYSYAYKYAAFDGLRRLAANEKTGDNK